MQVFVHYPETSEDIKHLENLVSKVHAEAVISYLNALPCPKEQKLQLIDAIINDD